jgi:hypothetical protein
LVGRVWVRDELNCLVMGNGIDHIHHLGCEHVVIAIAGIAEAVNETPQLFQRDVLIAYVIL